MKLTDRERKEWLKLTDKVEAKYEKAEWDLRAVKMLVDKDGKGIVGHKSCLYCVKAEGDFCINKPPLVEHAVPTGSSVCRWCIVPLVLNECCKSTLSRCFQETSKRIIYETLGVIREKLQEEERMSKEKPQKEEKMGREEKAVAQFSENEITFYEDRVEVKRKNDFTKTLNGLIHDLNPRNDDFEGEARKVEEILDFVNDNLHFSVLIARKIMNNQKKRRELFRKIERIEENLKLHRKKEREEYDNEEVDEG